MNKSHSLTFCNWKFADRQKICKTCYLFCFLINIANRFLNILKLMDNSEGSRMTTVLELTELSRKQQNLFFSNGKLERRQWNICFRKMLLWNYIFVDYYERMNAFLLDIQWKNDINSTPRARMYWNPRLSANHIPRIFILQWQIANRMRF
jgi:hypothetical protein